MRQSCSGRLPAIGDTRYVAPVPFPWPEIADAFDRELVKSRMARKSIFDTVAVNDIPIAAAHLPFHGNGRLRGNVAVNVFGPKSLTFF